MTINKIKSLQRFDLKPNVQYSVIKWSTNFAKVAKIGKGR